MQAPLSGVRVVELSNYVAAPSAAALMADLGADVIKVDFPRDDVVRGMMRLPRVADSRAGIYVSF